MGVVGGIAVGEDGLKSYYYGRFTGKWVKPLQDQEDLVANFSKGEPVIVFKAVEYTKWYNSLLEACNRMEETINRMEEKYKR